MSKTEELEAKIHQVIQAVSLLQRENDQLRTECDSLKSHLSMLSGESQNAQRIMADYELIRRKHDQVAHRVERALSTLNALKTPS